MNSDVVSCLSSLIPIDIVRDKILPFTYRPQAAVLLDDVRSYYATITHVHNLYLVRWGERLWRLCRLVKQRCMLVYE